MFNIGPVVSEEKTFENVDRWMTDRHRGLPSISSLFLNEFNKFNNTRARMLDSIYHMTLRLLLNLISAVKTL